MMNSKKPPTYLTQYPTYVKKETHKCALTNRLNDEREETTEESQLHYGLDELHALHCIWLSVRFDLCLCFLESDLESGPG